MTKNPVVLAIAPKSKRLGVAVFCGERLIYYRLAGLLSRRMSRLKNARKIIQSLIKFYQPEYFVMEKLIYKQQKTRSNTKLCGTITAVVESNNLQVRLYSLKDARRHFCTNDKPTKEKVANLLVQHYPELKRYLSGQNKWQRNYGIHIFSAVALGLYAIRQVHSSKQKDDHV
jgi:Holliday junction resolvasome RuvABC endonuclease subunit